MINRVRIFSNRRQRDVTARQVLTGLLEKQDFEIVEREPDLVVSIGGDGTLLAAIRRFRDDQVPFVGINTGSLGFLQAVGADEIDRLVSALKDETYRIRHHPLLDCHVKGQSEGDYETVALNDVVVERKGTRTVRLGVSIDGIDCGKVLGDGMILATPLGSTAYASAAGGTIVHPESSVFQMVPLNPHHSVIYESIRMPLVLPASAEVVLTLDPVKVREARVVIDGAEAPVGGPHRIRVTSSEETLAMLTLDDQTFWQRLFQKIIGVNHA